MGLKYIVNFYKSYYNKNLLKIVLCKCIFILFHVKMQKHKRPVWGYRNENDQLACFFGLPVSKFNLYRVSNM